MLVLKLSLNTPRAQREMKPVTKSDWHPADIIAAVRKSGTSLRKLDLQNGYRPGAMKNALHGPYPRAERIIAEQLGLTPQKIWPSRYDSTGKTNRVQGRPKGYSQARNNMRVRPVRNLQSELSA
jgi:Ner family transcriptional regulator